MFTSKHSNPCLVAQVRLSPDLFCLQALMYLSANWSLTSLCFISIFYTCTLRMTARCQSVLILTDNSSNVPIINKQRTRSAGIIGLLRCLAELAATHVFSCSATHISGENNVLADFLSRPQLHLNNHVQKWSLFDLSNSLPLSRVTVVCSSSLCLPNPVSPIIHSHNVHNVKLSYLPSLISFPRCH